MAQHSRPGQPSQAIRGWRRRMAAAAAVAALAAAAALAGAGPAAAKPKPPVLAFSPSPHNYRQVTTGLTASQRFTLANSGGQATGRLKVTLAGAAAFSIIGDRCSGRSLGPGKSCMVSVRFAPTSLGTVTATLTAAGKKHGATATVALTGIGVGLGAVPGHLYWTNGIDGTINVANLDGSSPRVLVGGQNPPVGVAVTSTHVYWVNPDGETVNQANLDGSDPHALFTRQSSSGVAVGP